MFRPPARGALLLQLEAGVLNGGFVFIQPEESFREEFSQFPFHSIGLGVQQAAQVGIIGGFNLIRGGAGTESRNGAADTRGDDEKSGGEDERAEDKEDKFVHALMILHQVAS